MGIGSKQWMTWIMEEEGLELLKAAWDRGLTTWGTANVYSSGVNEEIPSVWEQYPTPDIFNWKFEPHLQKSKEYVNQGGLSRGAIFRAVDSSLKRLGTDYIDLQIHRYDNTVSPEDTMKALHDLVQSGKFNYIGASSMWTYQFARMQFVAEKNGWTEFISMQNRYNLCYREEEREMNKFCHEIGVGLVPWSTLNSGSLSKPRGVETGRSQAIAAMAGGATDADNTIRDRVQEIAERKGWKMSQVALTWLREKVCVPIVGLNNSSIERLDEACSLPDLKLSEDKVKYLEEPYIAKGITGHT